MNHDLTYDKEASATAVASLVPPMPDFCVRRDAGETFYVVQPLSERARVLLVEKICREWDAAATGGRLRVQIRDIFPIMNVIFDADMVVV